MRLGRIAANLARVLFFGLVGLSMLSVSGCAVFPMFIPHAQPPEIAHFYDEIEKIKQGETTRAEISENLGDSGIDLTTFANDRFWVYSWISNPGVAGFVGIQSSDAYGEVRIPYALAIEFGPDGRVIRQKYFYRWFYCKSLSWCMDKVHEEVEQWTGIPFREGTPGVARRPLGEHGQLMPTALSADFLVS